MKFDNPPHSGPETSQIAAEAMKPHAETLRRKVLDLLRSVWPDGLTDEEIQDRLNMSGDTQRPRRWELVAVREVLDSGQRRRTRSGHSAIVWVARWREGMR